MKFRIIVKGECEVEGENEDEAIQNALDYFSEDTENNLDIINIKEIRKELK